MIVYVLVESACYALVGLAAVSKLGWFCGLAVLAAVLPPGPSRRV